MSSSAGKLGFEPVDAFMPLFRGFSRARNSEPDARSLKLGLNFGTAEPGQFVIAMRNT